MYADPLPKNKPSDAVVYVSANETKILALKAALWADGCKVHVYPDKRVDTEDPTDTQDVWVLYHNAPDYVFRVIRSSISF